MMIAIPLIVFAVALVLVVQAGKNLDKEYLRRREEEKEKKAAIAQGIAITATSLEQSLNPKQVLDPMQDAIRNASVPRAQQN